MTTKQQISNAAWIAKAWAMFAVIVAHTDFTGVEHSPIYMLLKRFGSMAVPVFLILAGYFFNADKISSFGMFLKKKAVALGLPWLCLGALVYAFTTWRSGGSFSLSKGILFLFGHGSYLYYLTLLIVLQILFYFLRNISRTALLVGSLSVSAASLLLTASGVMAPVIEMLRITNYLNVFNWVGFFAIGFYAQKFDHDSMLARLRNLWKPALAVWCVLCVAGYFIESAYGYFSWLGYIMELCSSIVWLYLSIIMCRCEWLCSLGKYSFTIYLLHIQIIPIVAVFMNRNIVTLLFSPVVSYVMTGALIWCLLWIAQKLHIREPIKKLIGMR